MAYKYTVYACPLCIEKYMEDDEFIQDSKCFDDFKDAKRYLLELLDEQVQWALQLNSRNFNK